jgi:hypothetical protein
VIYQESEEGVIDILGVTGKHNYKKSCKGIKETDFAGLRADQPAQTCSAPRTNLLGRWTYMDAEISYWSDRVMRHRAPEGNDTFAIHEVYFTEDGEVATYTQDALSMRERSIETLRDALQGLLVGEEETFTLGDLGYEYSREDILDWLHCLHYPPLDYPYEEPE